MDKREVSITDESKPAQPDSGSTHDSPGVIVFPPAFYLGTVLLGLLLQLEWPVHVLSSLTPWLGRGAGAILILCGGSIMAWGRNTMVRAGTNVIPSRPTLTIVTEGPFRFTRNPLYGGNLVVYLGLILIFNSLWLLLLLVPMFIVLQWGIVAREERYLEAKFGHTYLAYKARVRRWI